MQDGVIRSVAIIGGGKMGKSLFNHLVKYPYRLVWVNTHNPDEEMARFRKKALRLLNCESINSVDYEQMIERVSITGITNNVADCSLIIETITEDLARKNRIIEELEPYISGSTLLVSNSSSILPDRFVLSPALRKRFAGMHFFYPVETTGIVELILSAETDNEHVKTLTDFIAGIDKKAIIQNKENAFAANRFFLDIQSGLFNYCLQQQIPFRTADLVIKENFFSPGIFESMDFIGSSILYYAVSNYSVMHGNPVKYKPLLEYLKTKTASCKTGTSSGCGFIEYADNVSVITDKVRVQIMNFVRDIFYTFANEYENKKMLTPEELCLIIEDYTHSDYNNWKKV